MFFILEFGRQHLDEKGEVLHLVLLELDCEDLAADILVLLRVVTGSLLELLVFDTGSRLDLLHRRLEVLPHQLGLELLTPSENGFVGTFLAEGVALLGLDIRELLHLLLHLYFTGRDQRAVISNNKRGKGKGNERDRLSS